MAGFSRCDGPRSRGAPKRKLGQRRCGTRTTASSNRCVGPWGHAATQGGFRAARSPVTASHQSRAPGHVSGPVAARSRPPRRPRSQIFPQSAQSASKLQCPPHDSLENAVFQKRFGFVWQIPYWNGFGIPRNEFRAAHVAVRKSCAGGFSSETRIVRGFVVRPKCSSASQNQVFKRLASFRQGCTVTHIVHGLLLLSGSALCCYYFVRLRV